MYQEDWRSRLGHNHKLLEESRKVQENLWVLPQIHNPPPRREKVTSLGLSCFPKAADQTHSARTGIYLRTGGSTYLIPFID